MVKVYVRFGEFTKNDEYITCYEAILENNIVKIIIPTFLYSTLQIMARCTDMQAYLVDGTITQKGDHGESIMINCKIKIPLTYNKILENYTCTVSIPSTRKRIGNIELPKWFKGK